MATEIEFVIEEDPEGGFNARALGEAIFTQADDRESLREMAIDAVNCHFPEEGTRPGTLRFQEVGPEARP